MTARTILGITEACTVCGAQPGDYCTTATGKTVKAPHGPRWRAALYAEGTPRAWFTEQMTRVTA